MASTQKKGWYYWLCKAQFSFPPMLVIAFLLRSLVDVPFKPTLSVLDKILFSVLLLSLILFSARYVVRR